MVLMFLRTSARSPHALALDDDGGDEEGEVLRFKANGHFTQALVKRLAQAVLVVAATEFAGERLRQLFRHHLQPCAQTLSGAKNAGEEVEGVGNLRINFSGPACALSKGDEERQVSADEAEDG